ncbi:MAG: cytidine deaminase [Cyclobacteriaceae bacterium]
MKGVQAYKEIEDLDAESKYLVHKAKEAALNAYAPYSKFYVGAAVILDDDTVVTGANYENASYPLCMCAERVTLYSATATHPARKVKKMAVIAHKKGQKELVTATPCGACRQVMLEFEVKQKQPIEIVMLTKESNWIVIPSCSFLLPYSFNQENLI